MTNQKKLISAADARELAEAYRPSQKYIEHADKKIRSAASGGLRRTSMDVWPTKKYEQQERDSLFDEILDALAEAGYAVTTTRSKTRLNLIIAWPDGIEE